MLTTGANGFGVCSVTCTDDTMFFFISVVPSTLLVTSFSGESFLSKIKPRKYISPGSVRGCYRYMVRTDANNTETSLAIIIKLHNNNNRKFDYFIKKLSFATVAIFNEARGPWASIYLRKYPPNFRCPCYVYIFHQEIPFIPIINNRFFLVATNHNRRMS